MSAADIVREPVHRAIRWGLCMSIASARGLLLDAADNLTQRDLLGSVARRLYRIAVELEQIEREVRRA